MRHCSAFRRSRASLAAATVLFACCGTASALTFAEAFDAALAYDAQYQAAGHERDTAQEGISVARASLRPLVAATLSDANVSGVRSFPNSLSQEVRIRTDYSTPQASLTLRTPLFNVEATRNLDRAQALALGADAQYQARGLEMIDRLGGAYLEMLLAQENRVLTSKQVQATKAQLARAERRFDRGEGTKTEIAQSQTALAQAQVAVLAADDQLAVAMQGLHRVTGLEVNVAALRTLAPDFEPPALLPADIGAWRELALRNNPVLQARQRAIEAARLAVEVRRAGHYPRLDFVASMSRSQNESISTLNQTSRLHSYGLQLNVPLYSGGGVDASVRQAAADLARLEEEARADREGVEFDVLRAHRSTVSGAAKIAAQRSALRSSEIAVEGISKALDAGLATAVDVLDAQSKRFLAARDLAQARFDYLQSRLRLLSQAGATAADVARDIDALLTVATSPSAPTSP